MTGEANHMAKTIFCTRLYTCFFIAVKFEMLQVLGVTAVFATSTLAPFFFYLRSWPLDFRYYMCLVLIYVMFHKHKDLKKKKGVLFDVLVLQVFEDEKLQNPCKSIIAVNVEPQARLVMGTPFCSCFLSLWAGQQVREIRL